MFRFESVAFAQSSVLCTSSVRMICCFKPHSRVALKLAEMRSETNRRDVDTRNTKVKSKRRYPIGAELVGADETHFRLWAPKANAVDLVLEESADRNAKRSFEPLEREDDGYFSG